MRPGGNITVAVSLGAGGESCCSVHSPRPAEPGVFIAKQRRSRAPRRVLTEPFLEPISAASPPEVSKYPGVISCSRPGASPGHSASPEAPGPRRTGGCREPRAPWRAPGLRRPVWTRGSAAPRNVPQSAGGHGLEPGARDQSWRGAAFPSSCRA